jgi:hypothetical protein
VRVFEPNPASARAWTEQWLGEGHAVSAAVLAKNPFERGRFRTCVDDQAPPDVGTNFEKAFVSTTREPDEWLASTLEELHGGRPGCLVVEDDLSRPGDPALIDSDIASAFIGDRVVSWAEVRPGTGGDAVREVMRVGSGYPRNAFLSSQTPDELQLADRADLSSDFSEHVAKSLVAVIVAVYDAESYLVWDESLPLESQRV